MPRELPYIAAIGEAVHQEMERDPTVLYFGQNLATSDEDPFLQAFGADRVRVTPISETAEIGMAVGAAFAGYRPVVQLYMAEFMLVAMDQVVNEAPRFHYMTAGQVTVPIVLQAGYGFTAGWAGQHTGSIYGMFMGVPGLKVAVPATPAEAKGLMTASIRDDNPVVFFHHYLLTLEHGDVPEGEHVVPLGEAAVVREGGDVTIVAMGPGIVGTNTRLGFSGLEVGPILDATSALGGVPIACLRVSFADPRARHLGLSHHSATALRLATRDRVKVAVPCVGGKEEARLREDLITSGIAARHELVDVEPPDVLALFADHDLDIVSMGRPAAADPVLFLAAAAAGTLAARHLAPDVGEMFT